MMIVLLQLFILVLVLVPFNSYSKFCETRIASNSISHDVSLHYRRHLKACRLIHIIILAIGSASIVIRHMADSPIVTTTTSFVCSKSLLDLILNLIKSKGNVSSLDKATFIGKHKVFNLYLRGFECDDYSDKGILDKKCDKHFNEYLFVKACGNAIPMVAVGMTKEVNAPYGAVRVYVDDKTWKSDVRELMKKAYRIFILVNNRQSCVWEIEQANEMLEKAVFIVDDLIKYSEAQAMTSGIDLPSIRFTEGRSIGVITLRNGEVVVNTVENTERGYAIIAKANLPRHGCLFRIAMGIVLMFNALRWILIILLFLIAIVIIMT